jgi:2-methylisocitrate lyase-like PEP mutase family enzyme
MPTIAERRRRFRALHEQGCFVLPNPWDVGSTRYLERLGFEAVATTSAGAAFSAGLPDTAVTRDAMLAHIRTLVAATDLPVNADFEAGYADTLDALAANVRLCVEAGSPASRSRTPWGTARTRFSTSRSPRAGSRPLGRRSTRRAPR